MTYLFHLGQKVLCLLALLNFSQIEAPAPKQCILNYNTKPVIFSSLVQFQGSSSSFDPSQPSYRGNIVGFSISSIDRVLKNSFISFDSKSIIKLMLNNMQIKTVNDGAFNGLFCLHQLELRHNNISKLTEEVFRGIENLQSLDLSENMFENISGLIFRYLNRLKVLDLSHNKIRTVDTLAFFNLTELEVLNLSFNKIRNLPPTLFSTLESLKELQLNKNDLANIEPEKWVGLSSLEILNLADNYLNKFDPSYNFSFAGLKKLNLSGNSLTTLNVFSLRKSFTKLETIDISENNWLCEDLAVVNHELADSKIVQFAQVNCSDSGEYKPSTTEKYVTPSPATIMTTKTMVTKKMRDYSKEVFIQNGEILFISKKIVDHVDRVLNILIYLFVVVVLFVLIDISVRMGVWRQLYNRMTGRYAEYIDGDEAENLILMRR